MNEKYNEATNNRPEGERPIDAPLVIIDLPDYIKQIKEEKAWKKNDKNAITVYKTTGLTIVLIAMHKEATMNPHSIEGVTSIQLLEGKLQINYPGKTFQLKEEQVATIHPQIDYTLEALKKSVFLLTLAGNDSSSY